MKKMLKVKPFQETLNAGMCGPASLKIVLDYYGLKKSEKELARLTKHNKDLGVTAENIKKAVEKLGFKVRMKNNSNFEEIEKYLDRKIPVIVDWFSRGRNDYKEEVASADGHYSVVCGLDDKFICLQDPEIGKIRKMKREIFKRVWFDFDGEFITPNKLFIRRIIAIYK